MSGEVEWIGTVLAPFEDRRPYGALRAPAAKGFEAVFGSRNDTGRYQALAFTRHRRAGIEVPGPMRHAPEPRFCGFRPLDRGS